MAEEQKKKHSKHPFRKKLLRGVMFTFLALLFLEFLLYFGANFILADWARLKINDAAEGVYTVDFNRVRFSLIRRGVFLDGIIMKPIGERKPSQKQALFELSLDQMAIKNLWYDFSKGFFYVGNLEFDNPNISMDLPEPDSLAQIDKDESSIKALETEFKKIITRVNFPGIYISELSINHADLFFLNFLSHNSLKAEGTKLLVRDIDWTNREEWTTPFNAKGFEFDLKNVDFPLPDGVHSIYATEAYISSLDNVIDINGFKLYADSSQESKAYYDVSLEQLRVGNVALNEAFMTSHVAIDEIILNNPEFRVLRGKTVQKDSTASGDLNELIEGILESFQVKELSMNNGKFIISDVDDTLKNRIDIQKLDFKMVNFYLGQDEAAKENQFFYGEDAAMEIQDADMYLSDEIHVIYGDRVRVSSFQDEIVIENLQVEPREESLEKLQPRNIVRISLPKLSLNKANLKKLYSEGKFNIDEMLVDSPKVEITELRSQNNEEEPIPIRELLEGYLNEVAIGRLDLQDGEVQFKNDEGVRSNDIGFERFSLLLEKVFLQPSSDDKVRNQFFAEEMVLSLDKYRLKLRDNLHEFMADRVLIDSKNSQVVVNNFTLGPENPDSIQYILDTYGKSVILNLSIPEFRVEGIDLMAAYRDEKLMINRILVPSPIASFTRFRKKRDLIASNQVESSDEIEELLTSYFSYIKIDSMSFSDGQVHYLNHAAAKQVSLTEDSLSLNLKGFYLEKGVASGDGRTFFSDEIELVLRKYDFSVAGGNYEVDTDGLRFNSKSKVITVDNLTLKPSKSIKNKIALSLSLPSVTFEGVDIESFFYDNQLDLDKLIVDGSTIGVEINKDFKKESNGKKADPLDGKTLPRSIERVRINGIEAKNSKLSLNYRIGTDDFESIQTSFDLEIKGLNVDSTTNARQDIAGLFQEINLTLEDFSYALPDSMHTIKFSSLTVDNTDEETIFSDFEIIPRNTIGSPGIPIISAKIDQLGVQNNSFREIQTTGIFNVNQLRLANPTIKIYLDSAKNATKTKVPEEVTEGGLIESVVLQDLLIHKGDISLYNKDSLQRPRMMFENVDFGLSDLNLDFLKKGIDLNPQLLLKKDLNLSLSNYHLYTKDSLSRLTIGRIRYLDNNIILDSVSYSPVIGRYEYLRKKVYQDDAVNAFVKSIYLKDIDFEEYITNNNLKAHSLTVEGLEMDVFRDKRLPLKQGVIKPMPQDLMQNSPFDLTLDSVIIQDGLIRYQEFAPEAMLPGGIRFEQTNASIAPFMLRKSGDGIPLKSSTISVTSKLMGEGNVKLDVEMDFKKPYPMDVNVELGEFDLALLNSILARGAFLKIVDGRVINGKWNFTMDEDEARGKMNFKYKDLKIEFLDSLTLEKARGKLGVITFLANVIVKNNNPRKFFKRRMISPIYFERDKSKFIFGGWWRATFSGLKGSIGLGQPDVPKRKEEEE